MTLFGQKRSSYSFATSRFRPDRFHSLTEVWSFRLRRQTFFFLAGPFRSGCHSSIQVLDIFSGFAFSFDCSLWIWVLDLVTFLGLFDSRFSVSVSRSLSTLNTGSVFFSSFPAALPQKKRKSGIWIFDLKGLQFWVPILKISRAAPSQI